MAARHYADGFGGASSGVEMPVVQGLDDGLAGMKPVVVGHVMEEAAQIAGTKVLEHPNVL